MKRSSGVRPLNSSNSNYLMGGARCLRPPLCGAVKIQSWMCRLDLPTPHLQQRVHSECACVLQVSLLPLKTVRMMHYTHTHTRHIAKYIYSYGYMLDAAYDTIDNHQYTRIWWTNNNRWVYTSISGAEIITIIEPALIGWPITARLKYVRPNSNSCQVASSPSPFAQGPRVRVRRVLVLRIRIRGIYALYQWVVVYVQSASANIKHNDLKQNTQKHVNIRRRIVSTRGNIYYLESDQFKTFNTYKYINYAFAIWIFETIKYGTPKKARWPILIRIWPYQNISSPEKKTVAPRTKFMYLQFSSCSIFALWLTAFDAAIAEPRCGFVFVSSIRCMYGFHFQYYRHRSALSTKAPQRYIFIYVFILLYSTFQIPNLTLNARSAAPSANEMYTENMFLCCAMIWRAAVAQHVVHVRVVVVVMVRQTILVFTIYS